MDTSQEDVKKDVEKDVKKEGCSKCQKPDNVDSFEDIKPGDHISIKGRYFSKTLSNRFTKYIYTHHAIVNEVKHTTKDNKGAIVEIFHVKPPGKDKTKSIINKDEIALDVDGHNIKKISYHKSIVKTNEDIVKCAQEKYDKTLPCQSRSIDAPKNEQYRVLFNNCEHFCHSCCTDERESVQVYRCCVCFRHCSESCLFSIPKILRFLLKILILTTDDFMQNVYIAGGLLLFMLSLYALFVFLNYKGKAFCFCCTRGSYCRIKIPCCCCSFCKLTKEQAWYCQNCRGRNNRLMVIRLFIIIFFQVLGFIALVLMIKNDYKPVEYGLTGLAISAFTMLLYMCLPCLLKCCTCKCICKS